MSDILPEFDIDRTANTIGDEIARMVIEKLIKQDVLAPVIHAHWNKTCVLDIYQCSACKSAVKMDMLCDSEYLRRYCPNCGAKMDEK